MDIIIRDLNPSVIKELDEKAKENGVSRQTFLKGIIENYSLFNKINDRELEYRNRLEKVTEMLAITGERLEKNTEVINLLIDDDS